MKRMRQAWKNHKVVVTIGVPLVLLSMIVGGLIHHDWLAVAQVIGIGLLITWIIEQLVVALVSRPDG